MAVTHTFAKTKVYTHDSYEGLSDVIRCLEWEITFTDGTSSVISGGQTFFDLSDVSTGFTPYASITDADLEAWVKLELGADWDQILAHQTAQLDRLTELDSLTVKYS